MEIKICEPTVEDAVGTLEVQYKTWLDTYPNEKAGITVEDIEDRYKDAFSGERLENRKKLIENPDANEKYVVAKDGDRVVGMCFVKIQEDRNQLLAIYILPEYQRKGIGMQLWNAALPFLGKTKDTYVEVAEYNEKAINFYKKIGFVDTGRRFSEERFKMKSGSVIPEMEMVRKAEL